MFLNLFLFPVLLVASLTSTTEAHRVLLLCEEVKGHQSNFAILADGLVKEGHEVFWLFNENSSVGRLFQGPHKHPVFYSGSDLKFDPDEFYDFLSRTALERPGDVGRIYENAAEKVAVLARTVLLENEATMQELDEAGMDLAIVDGLVVTKYLYLIPHRLGIPFVTLSDNLEPWHVRIPWLPSFVPLSILPMTDQLSFIERVQNMFLYIFFHLKTFAPPLSQEILDVYNKYGAFSSINDIIRKSQLWITTTDPVLDYSKPCMPNMIQAGGLATGPANPLNDHWSTILEDANEHGIVLVSFGSASFPANISSKLLTAFSNLPQTVIWRFENKEDLTIPDNIIINDWLPLNDLLAHPNVEVFITHSSNNGQFEAIFHGVPMIGVPVQGDQFYNAKRMSQKGFGLVVDIIKFEPHELTAAVQEVISNPSYRENISKASLIFHDRPETPAERALTAIQQLLQFGGEHMKTNAIDMPLYQFLMLDVLAFCGLLLLVVLVVMAWVISCCWAVCCRSSIPVQTKLKSQ